MKSIKVNVELGLPDKKKLQSQFNHKTTQYIETHEDGTLKKYIHLAAS